jgi:hypothetical protein
VWLAVFEGTGWEWDRGLMVLFEYNSFYGREYVRYPSGLAFTPDGTLWIAWESHPGGSPFSGIGVRSVTPSGVLSRPLLPLPGTAGIPLLVPVSGGLAVFGQDARPAIELRRLSAAGKLRGHPVLVQKAEGLFNTYAVTPLPGGGFFVIFIGDDCPGQRCSSFGVFGRVLDSLGQPLTPVFPVNETRDGDQLPTGVVADPEGNVSVVWFGPVPDPLQYAVFTRRLSRAGKPLGGEQRISVQTQGAEGGAAAEAQGNFVVTWARTPARPRRRFSPAGFQAREIPSETSFRSARRWRTPRSLPRWQCLPRATFSSPGRAPAVPDATT